LPFYYGYGSDVGVDGAGVGGFLPRADPGALSFCTDGHFFFTVFGFDTFLICCAYDTSRVAFTA
jgi:hypothetical protein